tara:strand:- start:568 stop:1572 length:1005 start_codon:yes stop_codon:yes gene_type:complete
MNINDISLNYYSFGFYGGLISEPSACETILGIDGLVSLAKKYDLKGIEIPFDHFYDINQIQDGMTVVNKILDKNLEVFIDLESFNEKYINSLLPLLSESNINIIRVKMDQNHKTIYGGNRYLSSTFKSSVKKFKKKISNLMPSLEKYSVALAIENHQDFHSLELVEIADNFNSDLIGITWDVGNSLAVGDTIESFYLNAGHLIKNVHLKDYKVYKSSKGIRLLRCPLGDGVVDYLKLFKDLEQYNVNMSIELGAQITRECNINYQQYWEEFIEIPLDKENYLEYINYVSLKDDKSQSAYEDGLTGSKLIKSELKDLEVTVGNFNRIFSEINNGK